VARVSVLHSSILDYMVKLANERYDILASWPDFTTAVRRDGPILRAARLWLSKEFLGFFHHLHQIWGKKHQWSPLCFGSQLFPLSPQHSSPSSRPFVLLQYGKDFYYRAHPEDLKKFYAAVDEFHRIYDVVTEFESLNGLASEVIPGACACGGEAWEHGECLPRCMAREWDMVVCVPLLTSVLIHDYRSLRLLEQAHEHHPPRRGSQGGGRGPRPVHPLKVKRRLI